MVQRLADDKNDQDSFHLTVELSRDERMRVQVEIATDRALEQTTVACRSLE